jgi:hypothetical protein
MFSKNILVVLMLLSSLELMPAFNTAKKVGRSLRTGLLTTGTVLFAQQDMDDKEKVALHEAGHAVMLETQENGSVVYAVLRNKIPSLNIYSGAVGYLSNIDNKAEVVGCFGGFVQDIEDPKKLEPLNFMNQELGLPLAGVFKDNQSQLDRMWQQIGYRRDLKIMRDAADKIACQNLPGSASQDQIDKKINEIFLQGFQDTKKLVRKNQASIQAVGKALHKKESLSGNEIRAIIAKSQSERE